MLQKWRNCAKLNSIWSHFSPMQCRWKMWPQAPKAGGHSSPGVSQAAQGSSKGLSQMTQWRSSGTSFHLQTPTVCTASTSSASGPPICKIKYFKSSGARKNEKKRPRYTRNLYRHLSAHGGTAAASGAKEQILTAQNTFLFLPFINLNVFIH